MLFPFILYFEGKISDFKPYGGHLFLEFFDFCGCFLVPKINVPEKYHFFRLILKLLLISGFFTKIGPCTTQTEENIENFREIQFFPFSSKKTLGN